MNTEQKLKHALQVLITEYCNKINKPVVANNIWQIISNKSEGFLQRVKSLDKFTNDNIFLDEIAELLFDFLLVFYLSVEEHKEDYFESNEWNDIENNTLNRGSEFLNLLIYITEANDNEIEISLDDFLNEHLLVEDDNYQDEVEIYEPFITNPELVDAELDEILKYKDSLKKDSGIKYFLVPFTLFFKHAESKNFPEYTQRVSAFEYAVFKSLHAYAGNS